MGRNGPPRNDDAADKLTPRQSRLVMELLSGFNLTAACKRAGIGLSTGKRYLAQPVVREALKAGQRQSLHELARQLAAFDSLAITTLATLMKDETVPPATRRAAANQLLQRRLQAALLADAAWDEQLMPEATAPYPPKSIDYHAAEGLLLDLLAGRGMERPPADGGTDAEPEPVTATNGHAGDFPWEHR